MEIAKALILVGDGKDDRPWPTAPVGPKHLFPVANEPILFHHLEALRSAGVLEAAILAGAESRSAIEAVVGDGRRWDMVVRYEHWTQSRGLGGALAAGYPFVADEPVLVQRGDALLRERLQSHIVTFAREQLDTLALRLATSHAVRPPSPGYLLSPRAISILLDGPDADRNPVAGVRASGGRVRVQSVDGCLPCHGGQDGLLESNRRVLERLHDQFDARSFDDCNVHGPVVVHPTARIRRSVLRGPAIIGPGVTVSDSYIGPYTSIGSRVVMEGVEIEHSIVLPEAELRFLGTRLDSSVIGRGASVRRGFDPPAALRLSVGDGAEVVLR